MNENQNSIMGKSLKEWCIENDRQELLDQWSLNNKMGPDDVTYCSKENVLWIGPCGHEFDAVVYSRSKGRNGCPYCAGKRPLKGFNDLATKRPDLVKEWSPNNEKGPSEYTCGSHKYVDWVCEKGHTWNAQIKSRASRNNGCPYCSHRYVIEGETDLLHLYPTIALDWDYEKNNNTPNKVAAQSNIRVWWKCHNCGHEWKKEPCNQIRSRGCPKCSKEHHISFEEKAICYYLEQIVGIEENYHADYLGKMELDIYIPSFKIAVEYDGHFSHKNKSRDEKKNNICRENGIELIRIREVGCPEIDGCLTIDAESQNDESLSNAIEEIIGHLTKEYGICSNIKVDVGYDKTKILERKYVSVKENSLGAKYPELAEELHPTKNGTLNPMNIPYSSNFEVWWLGKCGHEWPAPVYSRSSNGNGCPYCDGKKVLKGFNDLESNNPELSKEFHPTRNGNLKPSEVATGSHRTVWWLGKCGHEWDTKVYLRSVHGHGCPYCDGKKTLKGFNDLETKKPELAEEWDHSKNDKQPSDYRPLSNKKVWWLGKCGHSWDAKICDRAKGEDCPYCSGKRVLIGFNDFQSKYPELSKEWHPTKNGNLRPDMVTTGSNKRVWWLGDCGHDWRALVVDRRNGKGKCPYCNNLKTLTGFNDLATKCPYLLDDWDYDKNAISPEKVYYKSSEKAHWKCKKCGHEWFTHIYLRAGGTGCPKCNHKKKAG